MYDFNEWRCIAREVVRAGGLIRKAAVYLRTNYEGFETIRPGTVRRLLDKPNFRLLLKEQEALLAAARAEGELETEKVRARAAAGGKNSVRQAAAEIIRQLREAAKDGRDPKSLGVLLDYLEFANRI